MHTQTIPKLQKERNKRSNVNSGKSEYKSALQTPIMIINDTIRNWASPAQQIDAASTGLIGRQERVESTAPIKQVSAVACSGHHESSINDLPCEDRRLSCKEIAGTDDGRFVEEPSDGSSQQ
jgi:hypothetical protein